MNPIHTFKQSEVYKRYATKKETVDFWRRSRVSTASKF